MPVVNLELLMSRVDNLPTLPMVALQVSELVNDPDCDSAHIAQVMQEDQALTSRVLALVNSAYYAIPGGVADVRRAISYLGYNTVYQLVLTVSVFQNLPAVPGTKFSIRELWKHSLGVAIASEAVAKHLKHPAPEEAFTAGLLHDIGKVAMASVAHKILEEVVQSAVQKGVTFRESEREIGLPGHDYVGRRLSEKWRLPASVQAAIGYHHSLDPRARLSLPKTAHAMADVVALADVICRRCNIGNGGDEVIPEPVQEVLDRLNLSDTALVSVADELPRAIERSKRFLELLG
ncbi:MAG: HDOD domain-containing protein [Deltaproteobacteria bacterium]|nr:HDOD domain-containing protein [Deltaproteobacteria bacterium]